MKEQRRLAAIVSADVAGYSRLMGRDESGTLAALKAVRRDIVDPRIAAHGGRIVKTTGDGLLLEFPSVVDAVRCVIEVQTAMATKMGDVPEDRRITFRVGVNLGDIIIDGDDIFGDGVNIAARLQEIAPPGGVCVSSRVHEDIRDRLDAAFNDGGAQTLKNIARPIQVWRWSPDALAPAMVPTVSPADVPLTLPDKPSIAVLPFQNMSGDPEQEYFANGIVEEIITGLSRTKALFVIARNSSFAYKGKSPDIRQVGRELGVRYVLEGSVRQSRNRVRVTGQLIEANSGVHIWADRFEGELEDVFHLQDEISSRVVSAIAPTLEQAEIERSRRKPTQNLDAYDFYLRGVSFAYEQRKEANQKALDLFHKAIALDPEFALAFAHAANCYQRAKSWGWSTNHAQEAIEAERLARRALELDRKDPRVLAIAGWVLAYEVGHVDEGAALLDSAIELDPNLFMGWEFRGWTSLINGEQNAIEYFESALRLSPLDPRLFSAHSGIANAHFIAGRYDEALAWAAKALRQYQHLPALWVLIASYALTGRAAQARAAYEEYKKLHPTARISNMREWARTTDEVYDKYAAGFRLAGMPE